MSTNMSNFKQLDMDKVKKFNMMRFKYNEANFEVTCESHSNLLKID